jgi:hypothetical protein
MLDLSRIPHLLRMLRSRPRPLVVKFAMGDWSTDSIYLNINVVIVVKVFILFSTNPFPTFTVDRAQWLHINPRTSKIHERLISLIFLGNLRWIDAAGDEARCSEGILLLYSCWN